MDLDSTTLIYIVAIIIYFLYSTFFRKKEPQIGPEDEADQPEAEPRKTVSFEDLLNDIRTEQKERELDMEMAEQEKPESPSPKPAPIEKIPEEEPEKYKKPEYASYEGSQGSMRTYEAQPLVKLDDQVDLEAAEKILGEVEDVAEDYSQSNKYAALLKNPETVREAIVLSEILQRKHF